MENKNIWDDIDPYNEERWEEEEEDDDKKEYEVFIMDSVPTWYSYSSGVSGTSEEASPRVGIEVRSKLTRNRLPKERKVKVKYYKNNKFKLFRVRKFC
jgi:hypothetical protein